MCDTTVVNIRDYVAGVLPKDAVRICRPSRWGNPFVVGAWCELCHQRADRDHVLMEYQNWLETQLQNDPEFLEPLRGKKLACWCSPLPCHGDIIVAYLCQ